MAGGQKKDAAFVERALFALKSAIADRKEADRQIAAIHEALGKVFGLEVVDPEMA